MARKTVFPAEANQAAIRILQELVGITTELFGENVRIYESVDPEYPDDKSIVFSPHATLSPAEIVALETEWGRRIHEIAPGLTGLALLVYPT